MLQSIALPNQRSPLGELQLFSRLFEDQVAKTPASIAVEFEGRTITYAELNAIANQYARYLLSFGYHRETRIGICLDRSIEAIQCMLGILKAGLAFVPLDPEFPDDRLQYIVEHADIAFIFCDDRYRARFLSSSLSHVRIESPQNGSPGESMDNLDLDIPLHSLAYVMYTSGSTGKPKGVQIEHRSLTTYCLADIEVYQLRQDDRTLQFSTLNFDVAIEEIFPPLLVGSAVVVRPRERASSSNELSHLIDSESVTALHIATAYWNEWVDLMATSHSRVPRSLRLVIVTGEKISVEHYRRWKDLCDHEVLWCNAYGPTETTVTCTVFIPDNAWNDQQMPIGKPLPGYQAYILDEQLKPVGHNETGYLYIGGPAVARGYLHRPDLTDKAFQSVQFEADEPPVRIYRTGDLARWLPSGDIEFAGRIDHQMKIGSYRIEPGEIETVMNTHAEVLESLVVCEEANSQKYLIAYLVPKVEQRFDAEDFATFLRSNLPSYMIPTRYAVLQAMPKTINGKVDRAALPRGDELLVFGRSYESDQPSTDLERKLADIWKNVLQLPRVGIHDDFFHLGGSSLLVTRVIAQLAGQFEAKIPVRDFFANPTIATLAAHLEEHFSRDEAIRNLATNKIDRTKLRNRLPRIEQLQVVSDGARLASIYYPAVEAEMPRSRHALLIVQSYGHEYTRSHRNLQQLSVQLSQRGMDVIRFDFAGTGDSDGGTERLSFRQWKNDVECVVDRIRECCNVDLLSLLGVRLGANLLQRCALQDIHQVIAWDPIIDGAEYIDVISSMHAEEATNLTRYLSVRSLGDDEFLGYAWPVSLVDEVRSLRWAKNPLAPLDKSWWISSRSSDPKLDSLPSELGWVRIATNDEIYWDQLRYANSAFAAPQCVQAIASILSGQEL